MNKKLIAKEDKKIVIKAEKHFDHNRLITFLEEVEFIFKTNKEHIKGVRFEFSKVEEISIVNLLVFFKVVVYTHERRMFFTPLMDSSDAVEEGLRFFGFLPLMKAYMYQTDDSVYKSLYVRQEKGFLIAPQPLLRSDTTFRSKLNTVYLPEIQKYYTSINYAVSIIFTCLSELSLNFWAHAYGDNHSILMAYGNKNKIEISCADTGIGIISTLKSNNLLDLNSLDNERILLKSIERGVTSKSNTNHMGYGLWLVSEIVKKMGGSFDLYSEGAYLRIKGDRIKSGTCGYWKGTIVYLSLPLSKCFPLEELTPVLKQNVTINWQ